MLKLVEIEPDTNNNWVQNSTNFSDLSSIEDSVLQNTQGQW